MIILIIFTTIMKYIFFFKNFLKLLLAGALAVIAVNITDEEGPLKDYSEDGRF